MVDGRRKWNHSDVFKEMGQRRMEFRRFYNDVEIFASNNIEYGSITLQSDYCQ